MYLIKILSMCLLSLSLISCGDGDSNGDTVSSDSAIFSEPLYSMTTQFGKIGYIKRYVQDGQFIHETHWSGGDSIQDSYNDINHGIVLTLEGLIDTQNIPDTFISSTDSSFTIAYGNTENHSAQATISFNRASIENQNLADFHLTTDENLKTYLQNQFMPKGAVQFTTTQISFPNPLVTNLQIYTSFSDINSILLNYFLNPPLDAPNVPIVNAVSDIFCTTLPSTTIAGFNVNLIDCSALTPPAYVYANFLNENQQLFEGRYRAKTEPLTLTYFNQTAFDALQKAILDYYKTQAFLQNLCADGITVTIQNPSCLDIDTVINHNNDPIASH